jgi:hypothetical protein
MSGISAALGTYCASVAGGVPEQFGVSELL